MPTDAHTVSEAPPRQVRRRRAVFIMFRSLFVATVVVFAYFVLPLDKPLSMDSGVEFVIGLTVISALMTWEVRGILRSPFPAIQAMATVVVTVPMFFVLFATTYYLMENAEPKSFSEPLTRLDSLYFTVTTFATVGFGDITAVSQAARVVTTIQMVLGLVLVGLIARVIFGAVQVARSRRGLGPPT